MRWFSSKRFAALVLLSPMAACMSSKSQQTALMSSLEGVSPEALLPQAGECPPPEVSCSGQHDPTVCTARGFLGYAVNEKDRPIAWGGNACQAKAALARQACAMKRSPAAMSDVLCVPDASSGSCPPDLSSCTSEVSPTSCRALAYDGQDLPSQSLAEASAQNPCLARAALFLAACKSNLNPTLLQRIDCRSEPAKQASTIKEKACFDEENASECENAPNDATRRQATWSDGGKAAEL